MRALIFVLLATLTETRPLHAEECTPSLMSEKYDGEFAPINSSWSSSEFKTRLEASYKQGDATLYFYNLLFRASPQRPLEVTVWQNAYDLIHGCIFQQIVSIQDRLVNYEFETQIHSRLLSDGETLSVSQQKSFFYVFKTESAYSSAKAYFTSQLGGDVESLLTNDEQRQLWVRERELAPQAIYRRKR